MALTGWQYLDQEKTEWIVQQAEAKLASTYAVSCALDQKVSSLRTISLTLLTAIIAYGFPHLPPPALFTLAGLRPLLWLAVSGFFAVISVILLLTDSTSREFYSAGTTPRTWMNEEFLARPLLDMLQGYIKELDRRIAFNIRINDRRNRSVTMAVTALAISPISGMVVALWPILSR